MNALLKKIIWLIIITPAIYLAISWNKLPSRIATHYDLKGNPDKYGSKNELWLLVGLIALVSVLIYLLITNAYRIDPKKHAVENKDRLFRIAFTVTIFMAVISFMIVYSSFTVGLHFNMRFIFVAMGFLWAILGNYMHNIKPNYFAGFRLPWTLENEENWRKTHLLGGKLWFFGGLLIALVSLFTTMTVSLIVIFTVLMILVIIPVVYSYRLYKKQKQINTTNQSV